MGAFLFVDFVPLVSSLHLLGAESRSRAAQALDWSARVYSLVLCLLPRRKRSGYGFFCLLTLFAPPIGGYFNLRGVSVNPSK